MLRGQSIAKVDDKGRVKIPSSFLTKFLALNGAGDERGAYVTSIDGACVRIYPLRVWEAYEQRLAELGQSDPRLQKYRSALGFWGHESNIDKTGRLLIHPLLRCEAGVENAEVALIGKQSMLELRRFSDALKSEHKLSESELLELAQFGI